MKKILIVNNNMKVGGVQKSLYNLLWSIDLEHEYNVTLLLFSKEGPYVHDLPPQVKVVECAGPFAYLGISQGQCKNAKERLFRGFLAGASRVLGRKSTLKMLSAFQKKEKEHYDCAIAYLHNGRKRSFYGGVQDYVLSCVDADKKIAFLHCDYPNCGADHRANNRMLARFDRIAACSDGCARAFKEALPALGGRCVTVNNCHRYELIREMAENDPVSYEQGPLHLLMVARLSREKGIERAICALDYAKKQGLEIRLHLVGGGALLGQLQALSEQMGLSGQVVFHNEQENPYRYMKNADLLLLSSYHEAAPMVIDEARCLGLPVLTTNTTSAKDMVSDRACGWVCPNSKEGLALALCRIARDKEGLARMKRSLACARVGNGEALSRFADLLAD